jgi:hypothetical protein
VEIAMANKYNARKATIGGITFDSVMEANRYRELAALEKAGIIRELRRQVRFEILPKTSRNRARYYTADFVYLEGSTLVVEDVKGVLTRDYKLRRDILLSSPAFNENMIFREYTRKGIKDY